MHGSRFVMLVIAGTMASWGLASPAGPARANGCFRDRFGHCLPDRDKRIDRLLHQYRYGPGRTWGGHKARRRAGHRILDTGYEALTQLGAEEDGYGLYSYVIAPARTERNAAFLRDILEAIPPVEITGSDKASVNILYIPVKSDKKQSFDELKTAESNNTAAADQADTYSFYDPSMAHHILQRICAAATGEIEDFCRSDISQGPFLFTYAKPVTALDAVPPPYLIVDLRSVHERAFPVFVSKFMEQVKRPDFADGERINGFKLSLLSIVLTAADWVEPVRSAVADIIHSSGDKPKNDNKNDN